MDIFNATTRAKQQSIKKPLNYPQASITEKKLRQDNQRQLSQFNTFLRNLYIKFDHKINKCKHTCITKASSYREVRDCEDRCSQGSQKFSTYVNSRVEQMQRLLGQCVANASQLHNTMDEIYYCYEIYNNGYKQLKQFIVEESMFYQ